MFRRRPQTTYRIVNRTSGNTLAAFASREEASRYLHECVAANAEYANDLVLLEVDTQGHLLVPPAGIPEQ